MQPTSPQPSRVPAVMLFGVWFCASIVCHDLSAAPVCALVDTTKLPVTAILEARLLADAKATWVERTEIDRVLGEQGLQAAFGAEGVKQRSSLGKLLKADILILLRPAKNPDEKGPPLIDCVVCETKRGLRLRMLTVLSDKNAEETAGALEGLIQQGLKKYAEKIESVVAVPPFLSEDLGLEFNYLQSAYAKLVEERLLEQPGLLVIELREAHAIAKELALDQGGGTLQKSKPPLYLLGRYRHDGVGKERTLRMSLRLLEGEKQLALKGMKDLTIGEAPAWISRKTTDILPLIRTGAATTEEFSAQVEAKRLAERGRQFQKVGSWQEAWDLYEASLLLDPSQEDVHRSAINTISRLIRANLEFSKNFELAKYTFQLYHRTLEHMELFLRTATEISYSDTLIAGKFPLQFEVWIRSQLSSAGHPEYQKNYIPEVRDFLAQERHFRKDTYLRIGSFRAEMGRKDYPIWAVLAVDGLEEKERYATILQIANDWQQIPEIAYCIERMTFRQYSDVVETPAFNEFMDRLGRIDGEAVRQSYARIKSRNEKSRQSQIEIAKRKPPEEEDYIDPLLEPVNITSLQPGTIFFSGSIPVQGKDIFFQNRIVYTMSKRSVVEHLFVYKELNLHMNSVVHDGVYVWIFGKRPHINQNVLLAIDCVTGKDHEFTRDDGLPNLDGRDTELKLAPVEPGKVCVIGYTGRSWLAMAELTPTGTRQIEVFFEAREIVESNDPMQIRNPNLAFIPTFAYTLRKPSDKEYRVLVGRKVDASLFSKRPLIVDPVRKTASVAEFDLDGRSPEQFLVQGDNSVFSLEFNNFKPLHLMRIQFPCSAKTEFIAECPEGHLSFNSLGLHIIGKEWWLADMSTGNVNSLVNKVPWFARTTFAVGADRTNKEFGVKFNNTLMLTRVFPTIQHGPLIMTKRGSEPSPSYWQLKPSMPPVDETRDSR